MSAGAQPGSKVKVNVISRSDVVLRFLSGLSRDIIIPGFKVRVA